jgi:hypothetical protein
VAQLAFLGPRGFIKGESVMSETELKPCPFCGAVNLVQRDEDGTIRCHRCDCAGPLSNWPPYGDEDTGANWNRRHLPEPNAEDVERVAKAIYEAACGGHHVAVAIRDEPWERLEPIAQVRFRAQARAAIAAMKGKS